jgi:hypothetical protein
MIPLLKNEQGDLTSPRGNFDTFNKCYLKRSQATEHVEL